jgi:hypothetical protein
MEEGTMRRAIVGAVVVGLTGLVAGAGVAQETATPAVDAILERHIEAVGGRAALERLETRTMTGFELTDLPTWDPPVRDSVTLEIRATADGQYLVVKDGDEGRWEDGCNGTQCWSRSGTKVKPDMRCDPRFTWLMDPQGALRFHEHFPTMQVKGVVELDGREHYRVDIDDDDTNALYFDVETGLLTRLGYNRTLSDFRKIDGVLVPFRYASSRKGGSTTVVFERIAHNEPLPDTEFAVPKH